MPSISELRSRLALAQSRKAKPRLSNLQCIDILLKVCRKNNVNLITSNDGMLFCTIEEVESQVENELTLRGGRIPIFDLNSILNFQPDYIDRAVSNIINSSDKFINSHGVIISKDYLRNLMISINDRIQEFGTVDISELSKEYDLPLEMIKSYVSSNIGEIIKGNINGNLIESYTFEQRKLNNIKVSLLALTAPVFISEVSRTIKININTVNDSVHSLLKSGEVRGYLRGGEYVPQSYLDSVQKYLHDYYNRNGFVEVKLVKTFSHLDPKSIEKIFPNNVKLDTVYINNDLFEPVSILINESISQKTWREIFSMLPSVLTLNDWSIVISIIKNASKNGKLVENLYVSNSFSEDLVKYLVKDISERREKVELFHKVFTESKLGSDHLYECVESVFSQYKDDHFTELYQLYPEQLFSMVEMDLKKDLLSLIVASNKGSKSTLEKKMVKDNTERLINNIMECEMSLKTFEKVEFESSNVLLVFMAKELCTTIFNLLLEYYLNNNKLVEGSVEIDPNNRNSLVEMILDSEVKSTFKEFLGHLKKKDSVQCVSTIRELCKLMYINYNVKKDSRGFLRSKQSYFNQQLSFLTQLDTLLTCQVCINLIFLKNNLFLFFSDKLWCLKEVVSLFQPILSTSDQFTLIQDIVKMSELLENKESQNDNESDMKELQDKTSQLISSFKP